MLRIPTSAIYLDNEPKPDWLIPDVLHKGNMVVLAGAAGVGKSFFSYALANSLATGTPFINALSVEPVRILYFDEENSRADLSAYARWTWRGMGCPSRDLLEENLYIESRSLSTSALWHRVLYEQCTTFKPDLVIIDTATPGCHIVDENDNGEASAAAQCIRGAIEASGPHCSALILKHLRTDHTTGRTDVRGAKAWKGAVDAVWFQRFSSGPSRDDGWRNTYIHPDKARAFGLTQQILLKPTPTSSRGWSVELSPLLRPFTPKE